MTLYDKSQLAGYRNDHRNVNMDTLEQWGNLHWKHTPEVALIEHICLMTFIAHVAFPLITAANRQLLGYSNI